MARELLFSVTIADCKVQDFAAGGPGGQHQNRRHTGIRITHPPSGAVGESREHRSQIQNKRAAFERMAASEKFQAWAKVEAARRTGRPSIEDRVEAAMNPANIKVEVRGEDGRWVDGR